MTSDQTWSQLPCRIDEGHSVTPSDNADAVAQIDEILNLAAFEARTDELA